MKRIAWIILIVVLVLGAVQLVTLISQPSTAALSITSPSGKASIVKEYDGQEGQVVGAIKISLKTSNSWYSSSTPILQLQSSGIMGDDGIIFGWENDRHLTIGWPSDSPPIHGPDHVGDIAISYRPYDPDIDRISGHNYQALQLHNIAVNFKETNQYHGWYAATHEPVPYIKCIIEISGKDGKAFEAVTAQIIGNGIGRSGDKNTSFGMVSVKYIFSRPVGKSATLTPTQATRESRFPKIP